MHLTFDNSSLALAAHWRQISERVVPSKAEAEERGRVREQREETDKKCSIQLYTAAASPAADTS